MPETSPNYINHIAFVLDESSSMLEGGKHRELVRVVDAEIAHLAKRSSSNELDQETRATIYTFADRPKCVIYDKDVLRLPSIAGFYRPSGMTALIDATMLAIDDLMLTAQKYGDHAFMVYVVTDGQENASGNWGNRSGLPVRLAAKIRALPENWTVATLVPDERGVRDALKQGFSEGNIAIWDAQSSAGVVEGAAMMRQATESFMQGRARGIRGTRSVFSTGSDAVNAQSIQDADLKPLARDAYMLVPVPQDGPIRPFVDALPGMQYQIGKGYYQLSKREEIQPQKQIAVMDKKTEQIYMGGEARQMVGLPDMSVKVSPDFNPDYLIFVQSTSVNRKLIAGTRLLIVK